MESHSNQCDFFRNNLCIFILLDAYTYSSEGVLIVEATDKKESKRAQYLNKMTGMYRRKVSR